MRVKYLSLLMIPTLLFSGIVLADNIAGLPIVPAEVLKNGGRSTKIITTAQKIADAKNAMTTAPGDLPPTAAGPVGSANTRVITDKMPSPDVLANPEVLNTKQEPSVLNVEEGVTQIMTISMGNPNRIVTPFSSPQVLKTDPNLHVEVKDNVLYVATTSSTPVTAFIREEGDESFAISVLLFPKRIPPREIKLNIDRENKNFAPRNNSAKAKSWETNSDYVSTLKQLMTAVAKYEVPSGYKVRPFLGSDVHPYCRQSGLEFDFSKAQVVEGHRLKLVAGTITNVTNETIEFSEMNCVTELTKAVSSWPEVFLAPGQKTEVYVVMDNQPKPNNSRSRASLLDQ